MALALVASLFTDAALGEHQWHEPVVAKRDDAIHGPRGFVADDDDQVPEHVAEEGDGVGGEVRVADERRPRRRPFGQQCIPFLEQ
jgi:hypothetical protein